MTIVKEPKKIANFFVYYAHSERAHCRVRSLFKQLVKRNLLPCIQLSVDEKEQKSKRDVAVYPNGILLWNEKDFSSDVVESCLAYISKEGEKKPVTLHLHSGLHYGQEIKKKQYIDDGLTVGQYSLALQQMEREKEKKAIEMADWERQAEQREKDMLNSLLDRYNIQKALYEQFGETKYRRNMERWLRVCRNISQRWSDGY